MLVFVIIIFINIVKYCWHCFVFRILSISIFKLLEGLRSVKGYIVPLMVSPSLHPGGMSWYFLLYLAGSHIRSFPLDSGNFFHIGAMISLQNLLIASPHLFPSFNYGVSSSSQGVLEISWKYFASDPAHSKMV